MISFSESAVGKKKYVKDFVFCDLYLRGVEYEWYYVFIKGRRMTHT